MADPLSIVASAVTLADTTKSIVAACTEYLKHAKNAPKELQMLIEDLDDLTVTIKKLEEIAKCRWDRGDREISDPRLDATLEEWKVPLDRLVEYASSVKEVVYKQDLKLGTFHELTFRAFWPMAWKDIQKLLQKIDKEKNKLHLATAIEGVGIATKMYMLVNNRRAISPKIDLEKSMFTWQHLDKKEPLSYYLANLGPYIGWESATYEFPAFDDSHNRYVEACVEHSCDYFLESPAYLAWKNRKTPGPSLLHLTGPGLSGKSILCGQVVRDLRNSKGSDIGIAYLHCMNFLNVDQIVRFYIVQLAFQAQCLPEDFILSDMNSKLRDFESGEGTLPKSGLLVTLLQSIVTKFQRLFLLLDDVSLNLLHKEPVPNFLRTLLELELGNVSVALFRHPFSYDDRRFDIADVSIRLIKVQYRSEDIRKYVQWKIVDLIKPIIESSEMNVRRLEGAEVRFVVRDEVLARIADAICSASDNLYLAADMFVDSTLKFIQTHSTYEELEQYLHELRESSEVMMQRDPEIMKQKEMIKHVPNRVENDEDESDESNLFRKRIPITSRASTHIGGHGGNAGEGSSHT